MAGRLGRPAILNPLLRTVLLFAPLTFAIAINRAVGFHILARALIRVLTARLRLAITFLVRLLIVRHQR